MRRLPIAMSFLLALTMCAPPFAAGQRRPKETVAAKDDYKALESAKEVEGLLTSLDSGAKQMTLKWSYNYLEPNPLYKASANARANAQYTRKVNKLIHEQQQAMNIQNPYKRMQKLQLISAQMQLLQPPSGPSPFRPAMAYKDFDVDAPDEVVVRRWELADEYDDKGELKKPTEQQKKQLLSKDPKVPRYPSKWDDLQVGQKVRLYLKSKQAIEKARKSLAEAAAKKDAAADKAKKDADTDKDGADEDPKTADKDKPGDTKTKTDAADQEPKLHAYMILIESDPEPSVAPAKTAKKKKKQDDN